MEVGGGSRNQDASEIARLAVLQHGVVSMAQLTALGFSRWAVWRLVQAGHLHGVYRGVYAVGYPRLTLHGRWMAAVLACGERAVLSHGDAAALHDLRGVPSGVIHVTAPVRRAHDGIRCHVTALAGEARTVIDAIAVTTVEQTVCDLAPHTPPQRLRTLIENAQRQNTIDFAVLRGLLDARRGRPGVPALTAILGDLHDVAPRPHPGLEVSLLERMRAGGVPEPLVNHVVQGYEVDFHWPAQRLVVESDGWATHRDRRAFENDRRRDAVLMAAGWRVLRITHERLSSEPAGVLSDIRNLLAA